MVNDPIGDFIIQLKNAGMAGKTSVSVPYSKLKHAVAEKLRERGYVGDVVKRGRKVRKFLDVELASVKSGKPRAVEVKRVSAPGRRIYRGADEIRSIRQGHGTTIFSTPKGILTGEEAKRENVGGEALFEIW